MILFAGRHDRLIGFPLRTNVRGLFVIVAQACGARC